MLLLRAPSFCIFAIMVLRDTKRKTGIGCAPAFDAYAAFQEFYSTHPWGHPPVSLVPAKCYIPGIGCMDLRSVPNISH